MKSEEIKRLVAKSENAAVEFKRARGGVPADFWPSYSSFANTDGGVIILGVREKDGKREIEGLANTEKIVADLWNAVNNPDKISANVLFNESIYPVDVDGKSVAIAGGTSDARNGKIFNIFSLVRIGERSGMGLSSLYGTWEKEHFAAPSIVESYEPDRTKVMVEFESDDSELGEMIGKVPEVIGKPSEVGVKKAVSEGENAEVKEKTGVSDDVKAASDDVKTGSVHEKQISGHVKSVSDDVNHDFEVLMGAYRSDFRENARKVLYAFAEVPEADISSVAKRLEFSAKSVWRRHTCDERSRASCPRRRGQGRQVDCQESGGLTCSHPSGDLELRKGDLDLTRRVVGLSGIAQIQLLGNLKELMRKKRN